MAAYINIKFPQAWQLIVRTSLAQDFSSKLWGYGLDALRVKWISVGIPFTIMEYASHTYAHHLGLSDLDKYQNHVKYLIQKISKLFMQSFQEIL